MLFSYLVKINPKINIPRQIIKDNFFEISSSDSFVGFFVPIFLTRFNKGVFSEALIIKEIQIKILGLLLILISFNSFILCCILLFSNCKFFSCKVRLLYSFLKLSSGPSFLLAEFSIFLWGTPPSIWGIGWISISFIFTFNPFSSDFSGFIFDLE